jgi:hypothetical protein
LSRQDPSGQITCLSVHIKAYSIHFVLEIAQELSAQRIGFSSGHSTWCWQSFSDLTQPLFSAPYPAGVHLNGKFNEQPLKSENSEAFSSHSLSDLAHWPFCLHLMGWFFGQPTVFKHW